MTTQKIEDRAYITTKLDDILKPMMTKMFVENPSDPVQFMQDYLRDNHGRRPAFNVNQRMELDFLREQVVKLSAQVASGSQENSTADEGAASNSDTEQSSEGSDNEDVLDLPIE